MLVIFNPLAFIFGIGSVAIASAVSSALGWISFEKGKPWPHEDYFGLLCGGLMAMADLIWRMRNVGTVNIPGPPTIITREGPVAKKPEPVTKLLNLLLSGMYGAQFFWVVPGWVAGLLLVWITRK